MKPIKFNDFALEVKLKKEIDEAINRALSSGWFILGKEVESFEKEFSEYLKVKHCIGVGNGLEALQISLMADGIGSGDEVITTPLSAVATTLAILSVGARPVFVDVDENGLIDANLINKKINKKIKAVMPVHLYGNPVKIEEILNISRNNNLTLIEDACQAHGSVFRGKKLGTFGKFGCFSFYPTKNLGAFGDGGGIVTNDDKMADLCRQIRNYGQSEKYVHSTYGMNSRLDEMQAAILRVKIKFLEKENAKRKALAQRYLAKLKNLPIEFISKNFLDSSNFHLFVIRTKQRDQLQKYLLGKKIPTLIHYPQIIPFQPFIKKQFKSQTFPNASKIVTEILSLPCHPKMNFAQLDYICTEIVHFFSS